MRARELGKSGREWEIWSPVVSRAPGTGKIIHKRKWHYWWHERNLHSR